MDKEAQEKIAVYVASFNGGLDYYSLEEHRRETYMEIGKEILELIGYRKLPEGKPPLLKITDVRIAELVVKETEKLTLDESEELIWLIHDKLKELNNLPRYSPKG